MAVARIAPSATGSSGGFGHPERRKIHKPEDRGSQFTERVVADPL